MTLQKIIEILNAKVIVNLDDPNNVDIRRVCSSDLISDLLYFCSDLGASSTILITGLVQPQIILTAEMANIKAIVFIRNKMPVEKTIELARKKGIYLLVTNLSKFTTCGKLYMEGLESCPEN